jgi:hypothetical protein
MRDPGTLADKLFGCSSLVCIVARNESHQDIRINGEHGADGYVSE